MTLFDDLGADVPVRGLPERVVSLVPALTEAVEVTVPGRLTGATDYCTHPPGLDVARVGGSKYPKIDRVLALRPDLVLANSEENRAEASADTAGQEGALGQHPGDYGTEVNTTMEAKMSVDTLVEQHKKAS